MNNLDKQYQELLKTILEYGTDKEDRTGTGTKSIFGYTIRHNMQEGFPLLTSKKMYWKGITTELMWMLLGDTNIKWLLENKCSIWTGDAYKVYERTHQWELDNDYVDIKEFEKQILEDPDFARRWGGLGFIYGKQWRDWNGRNDQIQDLIQSLKDNPNSRRLMVNAWNVDELMYMKLPPCHYGFQLYVREGKYLSLMWNQRSVDTFLGLPFNIASYGLLLEMIAKEVNMIPDQLIGNLGDVHLYNNHIEQAKELLEREPKALPTLNITTVHNFKAAMDYRKDDIHLDEFVLLGYDSHPPIKAPLSN